MRALRRALLTAAALMASASCGLLPPTGLKSPSIESASVALREVDRNEIRLLATLETTNPNEVAVPLTDLQFELAVFGREFASGRAASRTVTLAPGETTPVPVEFTVPVASLLQALRDPRSATSLPYRLRGSAKWGDSPIPLSIERSGDVEGLGRLRSRLQLLLRP